MAHGGYLSVDCVRTLRPLAISEQIFDPVGHGHGFSMILSLGLGASPASGQGLLVDTNGELMYILQCVGQGRMGLLEALQPSADTYVEAKETRRPRLAIRSYRSSCPDSFLCSPVGADFCLFLFFFFFPLPVSLFSASSPDLKDSAGAEN